MGQGFPYQSKQGTLITIGSVILPSLMLVLVILLRPAFRSLALGGMDQGERSGNWRPTAMVLGLLVLVFVAAQIPLETAIGRGDDYRCRWN